LSSSYLPIGAVLVSPEVSEVIHKQSNKLGMVVHLFIRIITKSSVLVFWHVCLF